MGEEGVGCGGSMGGKYVGLAESLGKGYMVQGETKGKGWQEECGERKVKSKGSTGNGCREETDQGEHGERDTRRR